MRSFLCLVTLLSCLLFVDTAWAQCACDVTVPLGTTTIDGAALGVQPGQTVCLEAGTSGSIVVRNLRGAAGQPVVLKACAARSISSAGTTGTGLDLVGVDHLRVTGVDGPITINGFSRGTFVRGGSSDLELDHLVFRNTGFVAIDVRTDPLCDGGFGRDVFTMRGLHIHHNDIADVGDAMYLGELQCASGIRACGVDGGATVLQPHFIEGVDVHDNVMLRSRRTTLKIACSTEAQVHHNVVRDYGTLNAAGGENNGLETRAGMSGQLYANVVERGTGHAVFLKSAPNTRVFNNVIVDPEGFGIGATDSTGMTGWRIEHNTIVRPQSWAVRSFSGIDSGIVLNTLVVAPAPDAGKISLPGAGWSSAGTLTVATMEAAGFVDPDGGDYALSASSPAIDVGVDSGVNVDFRGSARDARPDVGAFEFGAAVPSDGGAAADGGVLTADAGGGPVSDAGAVDEVDAGQMNEPVDGGDVPVGCGCTSVGALPLLAAALSVFRRRSTQRKGA